MKCCRIGHFAAVCLGKSVKEIAAAEDDNDVYFLRTVHCDTDVHCDNDDDQAWHTELKVCGKQVKFKMDAGADVSVMSEITFLHLPRKSKLQLNKSVLDSLGGKLGCKGRFVAETIHKYLRDWR